jgi:predicted transcriptional regulator
MSEGTVRQWYRMFKDGQTNVHDEKRSCQSSVVSDSVENGEKKTFVKNGAS